METKEQRLKRLKNNRPAEALLTMVQSLWNMFVEPEIKPACEHNMVCLLLLGIHAVAKIWSEILFNDKSVKGFKRYLELYVDGDADNQKFSRIADKLNDKRNIIAHQWLSCQGHEFGFNSKMNEGWRIENGITFINPRIYFDCFYENFPTWDDIRVRFSETEIEQMKERIIKMYTRK